MPINLHDRWEVFVGEANPAEARVYVRLPATEAAAGLRLTGFISGPSCVYSSTLAARIPLREQNAGSDRLWEAVVPDPCFWTPAMPFLYHVMLETDAGITERTFGIRPLAVRGRRLLLEGKTWVLRGARADSVIESPLSDWHEAEAAMQIPNPNDRLCDEASRVGVLLAAEISSAVDEQNLTNKLQRLAQFPAVGLVVLNGGPVWPKMDDSRANMSGSRSVNSPPPHPAAAPPPVGWLRPAGRQPSPARGEGIPVALGGALLDKPAAAQAQRIRAAARGLILVQRLHEGDSLAPKLWAQALLCTANDDALQSSAAGRLPLLVERPLQKAASTSAARAECDLLQRELAGRIEVAGFVV